MKSNSRADLHLSFPDNRVFTRSNPATAAVLTVIFVFFSTDKEPSLLPGRIEIGEFTLSPSGAVSFAGMNVNGPVEVEQAGTEFAYSPAKQTLTIHSESKIPSCEFSYKDYSWYCAPPQTTVDSVNQFVPSPWLIDSADQFGWTPVGSAFELGQAPNQLPNVAPFHEFGPVRLSRSGCVTVGPHLFGKRETFDEIQKDGFLVRRSANKSALQPGKKLLQIADMKTGENKILFFRSGKWFEVVIERYSAHSLTRYRIRRPLCISLSILFAWVAFAFR